MYYLIYVSSATELMDDQQLLTLLEQSRSNNLRLGITGMLLYKAGNFLQYIEGDKNAVRALYDKVEEDPRHHLVTEINEGEVQSRQFPDWSMGFNHMEKITDAPNLHQYLALKLKPEEFGPDGQNAYQMIKMFHQNNR